MAVAISLRNVVDEIDGLLDQWTAYLNRRTGELYSLQDADASMVEEGEDLEDLPAWQRDEVPRIREILESEDWLALPTKFDINEWEIMEEFSRSLDDPELRYDLSNAIRGSGAFRRFRDMVYRRGIEEHWYAYKRAALEQIAIDWLEENKLSYTRDDEAGVSE